ncbi:hypothetical protein [Feifania hominis]|uniref:Uncharacterized protein n=1 Tax=Feifania hominis TaxID=2763660 RepID=A0A926HTT2_9FIRM|nr:hypothetical protein [Feifania hominis]MBC8536179.1 hypothetical protein [Feifania hominis]
MIWDNLVFSFFFLALLYAIGTFISKKTKGVIIALIFVSFVYIAGYLTGWIPTTTPANLGIAPISSGFMTLIVVVHLGTTISVRQLLSEWRTVVVCLVSLVVMVGVMFTLGSGIFGFQTAAAAAGPISGGLISTMLTSNAVNEAGLAHLGALVWMVGILQQLVGVPVTSILMRIHVKSMINKGEHLTKSKIAQIEEDPNYKSKFKIIPDVPEQYNSPYLILAKIAFIAFLAKFLDQITNGALPSAAVALVLGVLFYELGFLDKNALSKANMLTFVMFILLAAIPGNFASLTVETILPVLGATLGLLAIGIVGIVLGALVMGKILKMPTILAACCGLSALYGFPSTMFITQEVIKATGLPEDQAQNLTDKTMPHMLIAGFTTVTVASVLITGLIVGYAF